jgi:hypothetical protein
MLFSASLRLCVKRYYKPYHPIMNANDPDDFLDFVDQAIFDMDDLIAYAQDESDMEGDFAGMLPIYQQIVTELKKLHAAVQAGTHPFGDGQDLPFMALVRKWKARIPIGGLLEAINEAQKKGFQ